MNHKLMSFALVSILLFIGACSPTPTPPPVETSQPRLVASATPISTAELAPPPQATPPVNPPPLLPSATSEQLPAPQPMASPTPPLPTQQPTPCGPPPGWTAYTIQPGDTLYSISIRTGTSVEQLKLANCLVSDQIYYNQALFVPYLPAVQAPPVVQAPTAELAPAPPVSTPPPTPEFLPAVGPGDKHLDVVPSDGPASTEFTIRFEDFMPNEVVDVKVFFDNIPGPLYPRLTTTADVNGRGAVPWRSANPNPQVGEYVVWAIGTQTRAVGKFSITQ